MDKLIQQFGEQHGVGFVLVLGRIGPLFLLAPLFSSKMIPTRARVIAAVARGVGLAPPAD
jgi:flagellar biosynthetic protein FliR